MWQTWLVFKVKVKIITMKEYTASKKELAELDKLAAQALVDHIDGESTNIEDLIVKEEAAAYK